MRCGLYNLIVHLRFHIHLNYPLSYIPCRHLIDEVCMSMDVDPIGYPRSEIFVSVSLYCRIDKSAAVKCAHHEMLAWLQCCNSTVKQGAA